MRAVVFDFFGTLTDPSRESSRRDVYDATAATLGLSADRFWEEVTSTFTQRATGVFGDTRSSLRTIAQRCGASPSEDQLAKAVTAHHECWFVGDGGSRELGGALTAGMRPVWVTNAAYGQHAQYRDDADAYVPADVVDDITDVLPLVGEPS